MQSKSKQIGKPKPHMVGRKGKGEVIPHLPGDGVVTVSTTEEVMDANWTALAYAIVEQAVIDCRILNAEDVDMYDNTSSQTHIRRAELYAFFRSEYCALILSKFSITGIDILRRMEQEREFLRRERKRREREKREKSTCEKEKG